jgi:GMP synthase (glutamine-hydrolysing)
MQCLALQHLAFEDLGLFAPRLVARGFEIEYRQAGLKPISAHEWESADLIVVLGGPIGAYEVATYPWLQDQIDGLRTRLAHGRATLGICLGAQLMARALDTRVYPGSAKEIGWGGLELSTAGRASPLRHLAGVPVLHWHGDTFDLPAGADPLAATAVTPNQAYALGRHALALQFHAEADPATIERWLIGHTCELGQAGISITGLREQSAALCQADQASACAAMLDEWLDGALPGR